MEWNMAGYHIRFQIYCNSGVMLSQRKLRLSQSPIKKAVWGKAPPVKIWASGWQWMAKSPVGGR